MDSGSDQTSDWTEADAEAWLLGLEIFGIDFGLERIELLLESLGSPQRLPNIVHVVGSNGKSSVTRMVAAILAEQGLSVGIYLSPHFLSFTERVLVDGAHCDSQRFAAAAQRVKTAASQLEQVDRELGPVTQFEALTAIAFLVMHEAGVGAAVIEAGLGGRLDATNVIDSAVQVCTGVSLEHTAVLGETVEVIAHEKLAVVRPGATLVVPVDLDPAALDVAAERCSEQGARLVVASRETAAKLSVGGDFQPRNFALAAAAAHALLGSLDGSAVERAAAGLVIPGRYELAGSKPTTIFDGAHNSAGAEALARSLEAETAAGRTVGCLSVLDDKDAEAMLTALAPCSDELIFTRATHPRAIDPQLLEATNEAIGGPPGRVVESPHDALAEARAAAGSDGLAFAAGSLYLIADLKRGPEAVRGSTL